MTNDASHEQAGMSGGYPAKQSISVFFPCYNEQDNVSRTVEKALNILEKLNMDFEVIIVNDGSSDSTGEIADGIAGRDGRIKIVHHQSNLGYGAALHSGFAAASLISVKCLRCCR